MTDDLLLDDDTADASDDVQTEARERDARGGATMGAVATFVIWLLAAAALGGAGSDSGPALAASYLGAALAATVVYALYYRLLLGDEGRVVYDWEQAGDFAPAERPHEHLDRFEGIFLIGPAD